MIPVTIETITHAATFGSGIRCDITRRCVTDKTSPPTGRWDGPNVITCPDCLTWEPPQLLTGPSTSREDTAR